VPQVVKDLQAELLGDYVCPPCPEDIPMKRSLTDDEKLSLQLYIAWKQSNGTVKAYALHAAVLLNATNIEILSLHQVRNLARELTLFKATQKDMCPRSCIAYTGLYKDLKACPYIHKKHGKCNEPRYRYTPSGKEISRAQVSILPVKDTIQAMYNNIDTAEALLYRDKCLKDSLHLVGSAMYSDYANAAIHRIQYEQLEIFQDSRDIALALSTDGAQLTLK
ncbi:hypothetical protein BDQ17DRAFT_1217223, partial [Cyathus striatus]